MTCQNVNIFRFPRRQINEKNERFFPVFIEIKSNLLWLEIELMGDAIRHWMLVTSYLLAVKENTVAH